MHTLLSPLLCMKSRNLWVNVEEVPSNVCCAQKSLFWTHSENKNIAPIKWFFPPDLKTCLWIYVCVWGCLHHFAKFSVPSQNTRPFDVWVPWGGINEWWKVEQGNWYTDWWSKLSSAWALLLCGHKTGTFKQRKAVSVQIGFCSNPHPW